MAWIQSGQEIARNPKTKRAARALGISLPQIVGHLHILWHWCLDFAPDGDLAEFDIEEIAEAAMWVEEPRDFVDALLENGFLQETEAPGYTVARWFDIGGKVIEQRRVDAERKRNSRAQKSEKDASGTSATRPPDVRRMSGVREEERREEKRREDEEEIARAQNENANPNGEAGDTDSSSSSELDSSTPDEIDEILTSEQIIIAMCEVCGLQPREISRGQLEGMMRSREILRDVVELEMARGDPSPGRVAAWLADEIRSRFDFDVWEKEKPPHLGQIGQLWERQRMNLSKKNGAGPQTGKETTREQLRQRLEKNRAGA